MAKTEKTSGRCPLCNGTISTGDAAVAYDGGFAHANCYNSPFEQWARTKSALTADEKWMAFLGWEAAIAYIMNAPVADTTNSIKFSNSSILKSATYGAMSRRLFVTFQTGAVWAYSEVPQTIWDRMRETEGNGSVGHFYNEEIKGHYPSLRLKS